MIAFVRQSMTVLAYPVLLLLKVQFIIYTNIQRSIKKYLSAWTVHHDDDGTGCGATCDQELMVGYDTCISQWPDSDPDPEEFLACWVTFFDSDCHDCLCAAIYDNLGVSCPA